MAAPARGTRQRNGDARPEHAESRLPIGGGYESIRGPRPYPGIISAAHSPREVSRQRAPGSLGLAIRANSLPSATRALASPEYTLFNRTGDGREYIVRVGSDEPAGSDTDPVDACQ